MPQILSIKFYLNLRFYYIVILLLLLYEVIYILYTFEQEGFGKINIYARCLFPEQVFSYFQVCSIPSQWEAWTEFGISLLM
jgi:hypothetical protein